LLLPHFCTYLFALNFAGFVDGAQKHFLPLGTGELSYATESTIPAPESRQFDATDLLPDIFTRLS